MLIELSAMEQRVARMLAEERQASSREQGLKDAKRSDASGEEVDLEGFAAELAFCKLANVYPDLTPGKKPVDAWTGRGGGVDVKATRHEGGQLLAVSWKKPGEVAFYVLMVGRFPAYRCAGFMRSEELLQPSRLTQIGGGFAYAAGQDELQQIEDLIG